MAWTKEQKKDILNSYWTNDIAFCPTDETELEITRNPILGRKSYLVQIICPRCNETFSSDEIEPEQKEIDEYTPEEKREILDSYFHSKYAICPRDDARLITECPKHLSLGRYYHER
jgi:hypothetical protein